MALRVFRAGYLTFWAVVLGLGSAAGFPDPPDFSGTWVLNRDKSDLPGGPGEGEGRGGGGPRGLSMERLVIHQDAEGIHVQPGGEGADYTLKPGAGVQTISMGRGTLEVEARWDNGRLWVRQVQQRDTPRGSMRLEQEQSWELSADGRVLTQQIKMKTPRGERSATRVFEKQ